MLSVVKSEYELWEERDVILLILSMKKAVYIKLDMIAQPSCMMSYCKEHMRNAIQCLDRTFTKYPHLLHADHVKRALLSLAYYLDKMDDEYLFLKLILRIMYECELNIELKKKGLYKLDFERVMLVISKNIQNVCGEYLSTLLRLDELAKDYLEFGEKPELIRAFQILSCSPSSLWPCVAYIIDLYPNQFDEICQFCSHVYALWSGYNDQVLLKLAEVIFMKDFQVNTFNFSQLLKSCFAFNGHQSVAAFVLSKFHKHFKQASGERFQNICRVLDVLPETRSLELFLSKFLLNIDAVNEIVLSLMLKSKSFLVANHILKHCNHSESMACLQIILDSQCLVSDDLWKVVEECHLQMALSNLLVNSDYQNLYSNEALFKYSNHLVKSHQSKDNVNLLAIMSMHCNQIESTLEQFGYNVDWIQSNARTRTIPPLLSKHIYDSSFHSWVMSTTIISQCDYALYVDSNTIEPDTDIVGEAVLEIYSKFSNDLSSFMSTDSAQALYTIRLAEQVMLKAIVEDEQPEWYPELFVRILTLLIARYSNGLSRRSSMLKALKRFARIDTSLLANLLIALGDCPDAVEIFQMFSSSDNTYSIFSHFCHEMVPQNLHRLFTFFLKKPSNSLIIDAFVDWLITCKNLNPSLAVYDLAVPLINICGLEQHALAIGKSIFRLLLCVKDTPSASMQAGLSRVFDSCARKCHPQTIYHPPSFHHSTIVSNIIDWNSIPHPVHLKDIKMQEEPQSVEEVFFMLGSLLRQRTDLHSDLRDSVSDFFLNLKRH